MWRNSSTQGGLYVAFVFWWLMRKWNIDLDTVKNCGNYYKFTFFLLHLKKKRLWKGFRRNPIKPYIFIVSKHAWNTMRFIPWNMLILWNLFCALHKKEIFQCTISMETIFKRYAENVLILILLHCNFNLKNNKT